MRIVNFNYIKQAYRDEIEKRIKNMLGNDTEFNQLRISSNNIKHNSKFFTS